MALCGVRTKLRGGMRVTCGPRPVGHGVGGTLYSHRVDSGRIGVSSSSGGEYRCNEAGGFLLLVVSSVDMQTSVPWGYGLAI